MISISETKSQTLQDQGYWASALDSVPVYISWYALIVPMERRQAELTWMAQRFTCLQMVAYLVRIFTDEA